MYYAILGYLMIAAFLVILIKGWIHPIPLLIGLPILVAVLAGWDFSTINAAVKEGMGTVWSNAFMFMFSMVFFGIMNDLGVFDPIINFLLKISRGNVILICVATSIIAMCGHLDGSCASTVFITIPAVLPLYKRLKISPMTLCIILAGATGFMNLVPWGGPTARVASVLQMDAGELWRMLMPLQAFCLVLNILLAVFLGRQEIKNGAGIAASNVADVEKVDTKAEKEELPIWRLIFNLVLTVAVIAALFIPKVALYVPFAIGVTLALIVNYWKGGIKGQAAVLAKQAPQTYLIAGTMIATGVFAGILSHGDSSILTEMANVLLKIVPNALGKFLHIFVALIGLPAGLVFGGDPWYYGVMPLFAELGVGYGISPTVMGLASLIGKNMGAMVSLTFAAVYLMLGMADVDMKSYLKKVFPYMAILTVLSIIFMIVIGTFPLAGSVG